MTYGIHSTSGGRPPGIPNKATSKARVAIAALVDDNAEKLSKWLEQIAEQDGPKAAWDCMMDVIEYHIPKLQRSEVIAAVVHRTEGEIIGEGKMIQLADETLEAIELDLANAIEGEFTIEDGKPNPMGQLKLDNTVL